MHISYLHYQAHFYIGIWAIVFFVLNVSIISLCAADLNIYFVKRHETLQKDLKTSGHKLQTIVKYIGIAIINVDKNGVIQFINKNSSEIFWCTDNELIGNILLQKQREQKKCNYA